MTFASIPAPGFSAVSGRRSPTEGKWHVQLFTDQEGLGWLDTQGPWPAKVERGPGPVWTWANPEKPKAWEVAAVKRAA